MKISLLCSQLAVGFLISLTVPALAQTDTQTAGGEVVATTSASPLQQSTDAIGVIREFADSFTVYAYMVAGIVAVFAAVVGALYGRSQRETKKDLEEDAARFREFIERDRTAFQNRVSDDLKRFEDNLPNAVVQIARMKSDAIGPDLEKMREDYNSYREEIDKYKALLDTRRSEARAAYVDDPMMNRAFADYVSRLPDDPNDVGYLAKRNEARARLMGTVKAAEMGNVDANLLFNSAMVASRLDMDDVSLKLLTYANYFSPASSHKIALNRVQMTIGRAYTVKQQAGSVGAIGGQLEQTYPLTVQDKKPEEIEREAFTSALTAAANAPLPQNEIIYAELWNMAQKTREAGGYERMRDVLLASYKARKGAAVAGEDFTREADRDALMADPKLWEAQKNQEIPSNLPGKISSIYALIGTKGWEANYEKYLGIAADIAMGESAMTTWRKSFIRDALDTAEHLGRRKQVENSFKSKGLLTEGFMKQQQILEELRGGDLAKMLKAIAEN